MNSTSKNSQADATWVQSISAITLFVEDLAETKQFYQHVFDMIVYYEDDDSAVFKFGETLINLLDIKEADELIQPAPIASSGAGARHVFTITVDDVDTTCADLAARGVALLNGPMDRPWGIRTASFQDPAGNIWEIAK